MRLTLPFAGIAVACALLMASPPVHAADKDCHQFAVTADSETKEGASARAQNGLESTIAKWRFEMGWRSGWRAETVTIEAFEPEPEPYWRFRVRDELFFRPDIVTETSHTVCWEGAADRDPVFLMVLRGFEYDLEIGRQMGVGRYMEPVEGL